MEGTVRHYSEFSGYGFIIGDDSNDYFVHWSFIEGSGYKYLMPNWKVIFDPVETFKGLQAHHVRIPESMQSKAPALRVNPFTPQQPIVDPSKFAGRGAVIINAVDSLFNHKNLIITGERGIGKSSVAYQLLYLAKGERALLEKINIDTGGFAFHHLIGDHRCVIGNTLIDIVESWRNSLSMSLGPLTNKHKEKWDFTLDLKLFKISHSHEFHRIDVSELVSATINMLEDVKQKYGYNYNGISLLIDEIDALSEEVKIAPFLKAVTEALKFKGHDDISFILAGVTGTITELVIQHPSVNRLFENIPLLKMETTELQELINSALANTKTSINSETMAAIIGLADNYPEPVHLLGYHTYRYDSNKILENDDLDRAISFIVKELKRQEFDGLYDKASEDIQGLVLRTLAGIERTEISYEEVASQLNLKKRYVASVLGALLEKGLLIKADRGKFKIRSPLFKIYLRWVLKI
ncbi:MAG: cold shock domain-containing protein [Desulfarculus sp.]|nr:cold shock domain-containing protein [Desulfarculus sp.]